MSLLPSPSIIRWIAPALVLGLAYTCSKGRPPVEVQKPAFVAVSSLNLRSGPSTSGSRVGSLSLGERVMVLQKSKDTQKVGDDQGHWFEVQSGAKKGWAFGPFLSAEPVASLAELQQQFRGNYYSCTDATGKDCRKMIQISGTSYRQDWFNPTGAMSDQFRGELVYGADYVRLEPRSRLSRPADYGSAYGYGYGGGADLVNMDLPLSMGQVTLYMKKCGDKVQLAPKQGADCGPGENVYLRR